VIPLGLRLTIGGGREAIIRLIVLAVAVGLGTGLLLTSLAEINAINTWNGRHAWFWTGSARLPATPAPAGTAPLWWQTGRDTFNGQDIDRFDVAAAGPTSPVPPGIPRDPGPGQYYASPTLAALLRSTPAGELADRYPGHLAGIIGDAGLPSPNSLVMVIGRAPAQLAHGPNTTQVTSIATTIPGGGPRPGNPKGLQTPPPDEGVGASGVDLIFSVIALVMLAPVLIFIATATRLSAARREQRFAALRLSGATRKQVSALAAVEASVAAAIGVAVGFGIFLLLRAPLAAIPFAGRQFFPGNLSLSLPDILAVVIGVPAAAAIAARLALRRVNVSPLGVARRATPRPPQAWRVLPLLAGAAEIGFFVAHGQPATPAGQVEAFVPGFGLILVGLVIAGPWLTMAGARLMARRTSRPATMLAARRLADDPHAAFRAVSGLVLALFITTVAVAGLATQDARDVVKLDVGGPAAAGILTQVEGPIARAGFYGQAHVAGTAPALSAAQLARLRQIDGVTGVVEVRSYPRLDIPAALFGSAQPAGLASCAQLASVPALGRCPAGATNVAFPQSVADELPVSESFTGITWPAVNVPAGRLGGLQLYAINVATNGSVPAIERARTFLENASPGSAGGPPSTLGETSAQANSINDGYQQLANAVILVSLPIAGCTLLASVAAGLADRKRPFSLLRLTGARLAMLRRVVLLESAVPLLVVAAVAIGAGFGAAAMYASVMIKHSLVAPGAAYYLITAVGIIASLAIIGAMFPLLTRVTGPEVARNE